MSDKELSWRFIEERVGEDADIERARKASLEHGVDPITASAGQYIATIATSLDAKSIIEVGTGLGVGSVPLFTRLREAGNDGVPRVLSDPATPATQEIIRVADAIVRGGESLAGKKLPFA